MPRASVPLLCCADAEASDDHRGSSARPSPCTFHHENRKSLGNATALFLLGCQSCGCDGSFFERFQVSTAAVPYRQVPFRDRECIVTLAAYVRTYTVAASPVLPAARSHGLSSSEAFLGSMRMQSTPTTTSTGGLRRGIFRKRVCMPGSRDQYVVAHCGLHKYTMLSCLQRMVFAVAKRHGKYATKVR